MGFYMNFDLQKASLSKRLSAFLIDFLIFCLVALAIAPLISNLVGYNAKLNEFKSFYDKYEEIYGIDTNISAEEYNALSDADKIKFDQATAAINSDKEMLDMYADLISLILLVISISILLSFIILEVVIPLIFKNGQTLGKKIFGIAVMRTDGVRITPFQVCVRAILGKFTVETMFPLFLLLFVSLDMMGLIGFLVIGALLILQIVVMIATKTNSMIHDLFAVTVTVDLTSQTIFNTVDDLIEYKKRIAEEKANEKPY